MIGVIIVDQLSKYYALIFLKLNKISIIPDFLSLELFWNKGIAFSIPVQGIIIPILATLIITIILIKYSNTIINYSSNLTKYSIGLIYGGALSNITDRIIHGAVIDFISVLSFPVFNIADCSISVAALMIIIFQKRIFI